MSDASNILDTLLKLAKAVAPVIGGGAPEIIELGEKVIETIDQAIDIFSEEDDEALREYRDALEEKIRKQVGDTVSRLRGE